MACTAPYDSPIMDGIHRNVDGLLYRTASFVNWYAAQLYHLVKKKSFIIGILFTIALLVFYQWKLMCNLKDLHIKYICNSYDNGRSVGNLCQPLCAGAEQTNISSISCKSLFQDDQIIFSGVWIDEWLLFKFPKINREPKILERLHRPKQKPEEKYLQMVSSRIKRIFNMNMNENDVKKFSYFFHTQSRYKRDVELNNLWTLMHDDEYLALTVYEKYDLFPKIVGSCGPIYAVQYLVPIASLRPTYTFNEWRRRLKDAIKIMTLLTELELADPLRLCNVKMNDFGLTMDNKKVKYTNMNSVHPLSVVDKKTASFNSCERHSDCDYMDCRSFCNLVTKRCEYGVVNNNLQMVCERIFLGWVVSGKVMVPGLLVGPATPQTLTDLLNTCANPNMESGDMPRASTPIETHKHLVLYLTVLSDYL